MIRNNVRLARRARTATLEGTPLAVVVASDEQELLTTLRDALDRGRMQLAFQPAVYSADPGIIGFYEGYIRLQDQRGLTIPAAQFMSLAETREIGREIDLAALRLGLRTLSQHPDIRVAVNMSARSIGYAPWTQLLRRALQRDPLIGRGLILEINEASAVAMPDLLHPFMQELRGYGIAFTLDDFGDGLTSLTWLAHLGFDIAKLDGRLVRGCHIPREAGNQNQPVLRAAIAMAQAFDMFLVAESVETLAEAEWLRDHGVGCLQGYLFGKPELDPDFSLFQSGR